MPTTPDVAAVADVVAAEAAASATALVTAIEVAIGHEAPLPSPVQGACRVLWS